MVSSSMKKIRGIKKCPVCKRSSYIILNQFTKRKVLISNIIVAIPVGGKMVMVNQDLLRLKIDPISQIADTQ